MIEPGSPAPDFTLRDQDGDEVSLEDLRGKRTILVFYPADFSPVCTDQLSIYQEVLPEFEDRDVQLYGVSVDNVYCHNAFQRDLHISIPLLADFHPKGEVSQRFGVYAEGYGLSKRALVMIGPDLTVEWVHKGPPLEIPGANLIFDALDQHAPA